MTPEEKKALRTLSMCIGRLSEALDEYDALIIAQSEGKWGAK